ncbi:MAG TPA: TVP38/TMEM64 family protein [Candidatus Brocadiaceae bacterium]
MTINEKKGNKNHIWIKLLVLLFIVGGITLIFYETGLIHFFLNKERLVRFLNSLGPATYIGFILLQVAQVIAAFIPGEVTGLLGGFLYGPFLGVILSTIGLTIGSYVAFTLSRIFGRPFVEKFVNRSIMERFDYLLHKKGAFLAFVFFLIPGFPKDYFCYILGLGHLSTMEFLAISGTGRLFGTILLTIGGNYLRNYQYQKFYILMGVALILFLVAMAFKDKLESLFRSWQSK